jgi:hypothetical protein
MTKNGIDIQTISTKRTDFQTDRFLLLGQVTEKKEKPPPSYFLKILLANRTNGTFGFDRHTEPTLRETKRDKSPTAQGTECFDKNNLKILYFNNLNLTDI